MKMLHHKPHHVITSYTNNSYCPYSVRLSAISGTGRAAICTQIHVQHSTLVHL